MPRLKLLLALAIAVSSVLPAGAGAQAIPRTEYLRYVPLEYPALVQQAPASAAFQLFGDRTAAGYRDEDPVDGIDDARGRRLQELAARFGPIMVLNTTNLPMDFRKFMERSRSFNLNVDTWSLLGHPQALLRSREVDILGITGAPCPELPRGSEDPAGDCLLLELLRRYDPRQPDYPALAPRAVPTDQHEFEVMFFDFPGEDPDSWKAEFENNFSGLLPAQYRDFLKVYVHPFIHETRPARGGEPGYEFVLQYYLFYPTNDGGNNHEGDWEHINVSIAPRSTVHRLLTADEVQSILLGSAVSDADADSPLVIRHVDYYFHHQVFRMDYTSPDAYAPRVVWERQRDQEPAERHGQQRIWEAIRHLAWWDDEETLVNTHPICYVGADNKGLDQLLSPPGGTNRDSHGTYPFPGLYKDIGPSGATEQINSFLDHRRWRRERGGDITGQGQKRFGRGDAVPYTTVERVEILPDWERVLEPVMTDPVARRDWFWMILPVRWGYPAVESPFAGVVAHAETGNLSPPGPMAQPHWNRVGSEGGSNQYLPHRMDTLFPLGLQDGFVNSWGYLNLTLPVLVSLPPLDFAWRVAAYPFRALLQRDGGVYFPAETIPSRFVGLNVGVSSASYNDDAVTLVLNGEVGLEALLAFAVAEPDAEIITAEPELDRASTMWWQVNFYLGSRLVSQNTLLHARNRMALRGIYANGGEHVAESELNLWEYAGSFRYDVLGGGFRPYVKLGYGWTWYRSEKARFDGEALSNTDGEWINRPSFDSFADILPNSWHAGLGLEIIGYRSGAPFPSGLDASLVGEITYTQTGLGLDDELLIVGSGDFREGLIDPPKLRRWTFSLGITLGL